MSSNSILEIAEIKKKLESCLNLFGQYSTEVFGAHDQVKLDQIRVRLQRMEPEITNYLIQINGDGVIVVGDFGLRQRVAHRDLLGLAVIGGNNELRHNFGDFDDLVKALINRALGRIDAGLWPPTSLQPVLTINDAILKKRCLDLLRAPGAFDRVVREATLILEDRLRNRISHDRLSALIPDSAKQTGENLVNTLLNPGAPILSISTDTRERASFHRIMLGVFAYLRNPFHHHIDDTTDWSWSWSIVGFIDHLLYELDNCDELK